MTKTFLVIDNTHYCFYLDSSTREFARNGVKADFKGTAYSDGAFSFIQEWQNRGLGLDIIMCDLCAMDNNHGVDILTNLLDRVKNELGEFMLPKQLFFHSANRRYSPIETPYGTSPGAIDEREIHMLYEEQGIFLDRGWGDAQTRVLRDYLNQNWGTRFVMSKAEEMNLVDPECSLDPCDVDNLLRSGGISPEAGLRRISLSNSASFVPVPYVDLPMGDEDRPCELEFKQGVRGAVSGVLALTSQDILRFRETQPQDSVILVIQNARGYEAPPQGVDGLVILEDGLEADHMREICTNMGVPLLIGAIGDSCVLSSEALSFTRRMQGQYRESGLLSAGSGITIDSDTDSGSLYSARLPLQRNEGNMDWYAAMLDVADEQQRRTSLQIKANADTADQVRAAIKARADGIGLVRSEHMFFVSERKKILQACLLSEYLSDQLVSDFQRAQQEDFQALLQAATSVDTEFPVAIRLLDLKPHEFMMGEEVAVLEKRIGKENMRGVQFGLVRPRLYEAQISALCEAFQKAAFSSPLHVVVPGVRREEEMQEVCALFDKYARGSEITLGPMVETVSYAEYLANSFVLPYTVLTYGTSDLTSDRMGGVVRNDIPAIMAWLKENPEQEGQPFFSLIPLVRGDIMAIQGRIDSPQATICGRQVAEDRKSICWAVQNGISLSVPFQSVPYAKLIAGQEFLKSSQRPEP